MAEKVQRYLVRKETGDVFIWTEIKAQRKDLVEVWAESPAEALRKQPMPDPLTVSLDEIDRMSKADMLLFASYKLGLKLDAANTKDVLADQIKEAIFTRGQTGPEGQIAMAESKPFASPRDMRGKTGVDAKIARPGEAVVASDHPNQPVRP